MAHNSRRLAVDGLETVSLGDREMIPCPMEMGNITYSPNGKEIYFSCTKQTNFMHKPVV